MKPITIFLIVLYFVLFSLAGVWSYYKYFRPTTSSESQPQTIDFKQDKTILYTIGNNLYQLNADNLNRDVQDPITFRLQSTGEVQTVVIDQKNEFFIYDCLTPEKNREIWQVIFKDNHSEKVFSKTTPGFELYTDFRSPKMSVLGRKMAFLASNQGVDDIFLWDINLNTVQNLTLKSVKEKITALEWSQTESKIYFATASDNKTVLKSIDLKKKIANIFEGINTVTQIRTQKDKILIVFLDSNEVANLGYINLAESNKINPITDLKTPSSVINFDVSDNNKQIVYQIQNTLLKTNDLYTVNLDGSNLLQLTTDGKSFFPLFSPDSKKIAFYLANSGIYQIGVLKDNKTKLLNEESQINKLILWR